MPQPTIQFFRLPTVAASFTPAITLSRHNRYPATRNGLPCAYYWKEMLKLGRVVGTNGVEQTITPERMTKIVTDYQRARAKGHEPYLPIGVHTSPDQRGDYTGLTDLTEGKKRNAGFLVDIEVRGESLFGLHQFVGKPEETAKLAACQKSSIGIFRGVVDGDGEVFDEFLDHNAILPDPQILGLGDFTPAAVPENNPEPALAASRGQPIVAETFVYAREEPKKPQGATMPLQALTADHVGKIKNIIKAKGGDAAVAKVTEDNAIDTLLAQAEALAATPAATPGTIVLSREQLDRAKKATGNDALTEANAVDLSLAALEKANTDVKTATTAADEAKLTLSRSTAKPLDPEVAHERVLRIKSAISQLPGHGYSKAFIDTLTPRLLGSDGKGDPLMLSRSAAGDIHAMEWLELLKTHKPAPTLGTNTGDNMLLNRDPGGSGGAQPISDDKNDGILLAKQFNERNGTDKK
jgi:hypothetical protein